MTSSERLIIMPGSRFRVIWNYVAVSAITYHVLLIPAEVALDVPHGRLLPVSTLLDVLISLFFTLDILVNFRTAFTANGETITDATAIAKHYRRSWLAVDLVALMPFDLLALGLGHGEVAGVLSFLRLVRVAKVRHLILSLSPALVTHALHARFAMLFFWTMAGINLITCLWLAIQPPPGTMPVSSRYVEGLYWTVTTLTTVGYGDITPKSDGARLFTMLVMLVGVAFYAVIIGNISALVVDVNAHKRRQKEKMASLANFMRQYRIPRRTQTDIFSFYRHYLDDHASQDDEILSDLPPKLQEELQTHINIAMLTRTPLLKKADAQCLLELANTLEPLVFSPGEEIIRAGETGHEMYLLSHGVVQVTSPEGKSITKLYKRSVFGEVALLKNVERNATVRATTFCDLYKLNKSDFDRITARYPSLRADLEAMADARNG